MMPILINTMSMQASCRYSANTWMLPLALEDLLPMHFTRTADTFKQCGCPVSIQVHGLYAAQVVMLS